MIDIGGNNHAPARHFRPDQFGRQILPARNVIHLAGDDALPRIVHLRAYRIVSSLLDPLRANHNFGSADAVSSDACAIPPLLGFGLLRLLDFLAAAVLRLRHTRDSPFVFKL